MLIKDWINQRWKYIQLISEWIMFGVLIYLVLINGINIHCRLWCKNLVQPILNQYGNSFGISGKNVTLDILNISYNQTDVCELATAIGCANLEP